MGRKDNSKRGLVRRGGLVRSGGGSRSRSSGRSGGRNQSPEVANLNRRLSLLRARVGARGNRGSENNLSGLINRLEQRIKSLGG